MKIGLDFDGVIADQLAIKALVAKELFGQHVALNELKKEVLEETGSLSLDQYEQVKRTVYEIDTNMERTPEIPGAIESIKQLLDGGHELRVITSRHGQSVELADRWLKARNVTLPIISVGYGVSKHSAIAGEQLFVDDDVPKLEQLFGSVPNLVLFEYYPPRVVVQHDPRLTVLSRWPALLKHIAALQVDSR